MSEIQKTGRGFGLLEFVEGNGEACSVQQSSAWRDNDFNPEEGDDDELPGATMLWLGVDSVVPQVLKPGAGWVNVELPPETLCSGRMHLTRANAAALGSVLTAWAETGQLETPKIGRLEGKP